MMSRNTSQISEFQNPHKQVIAHLVTRSFRNYFFFLTPPTVWVVLAWQPQLPQRCPRVRVRVLVDNAGTQNCSFDQIRSSSEKSATFQVPIISPGTKMSPANDFPPFPLSRNSFLLPPTVIPV